MSEIIDELLADAGERMTKSVESTNVEFASVRTGRASPALLDRVVVDYYGAPTPLKQLATINAPEVRLLSVQPFDQSSIKVIEKAIMETDLGLTPSNDGKLIRLSIPELNEERRRELVKQVRHIAEEGRIAIRNVRRDIMHDLRELRSEGEVGSDDEHRGEVELQKLTDAQDQRPRRVPEGQGSGDHGGVMAAGGRAARYVAIITDGNGRWAAERGLPTIEGHRAGADTVKARLMDAAELGVQELTVYSFSTENWARPAEEVTALMRMFSERIRDETPELRDEGVRMRFIGAPRGRRGRAARADGRGRARRPRRATGSRCSSRSTTAGAPRSSTPRSATTGGGEDAFRALLYAPEMHEPDVVIRTSGEQRLSNYLLWQAAYSELVFRDELWPDFTREAFVGALDEFEQRSRRFGGR